ncbi:MAG TPA: hypothetical protein IGS17_09760 [Oscillatoriales cyanobacterium M59_W2019_021]|nr:MAG: hypothetical protein D6728_08920 [Cyanobacteria bacterium J055]HIK30017.1 hypothetical protein [Oscillatoriales cyanobacterium M4454_W2019_049]HIK51193.1 hypothetical protein [Oscillatoriales cyanobacterium M59_W2019_021]
MATQKSRTTVSFDPEDYDQLQQWADEEFRSVPQLIHAIVKKALIDRHSPDSDSTQPAEPKS